MKILVVNTEDINGGAAKAAHRLKNSLTNEGIDVSMLVHKKSGTDKKVIETPISVFSKLDRLLVKFYKNRSQTLFSPSLINIGRTVQRINEIDPDIVHLHWICGSLIPIEQLSRIKAPIVWSLHDMWPFTGGCHYDEDCNKYKDNCNNCPVLGSSNHNDLSNLVFKKKIASYTKIPSLTIIGLSRWMRDSAKSSKLFSNRDVINLPNPIDTNNFCPRDYIEARKSLNLPLNKKLILFGAMNATSDPRKGFGLLSDALKNINNSEIELVVYGSSGDDSLNINLPVHFAGHISCEDKLIDLYNACDVMVVPSIQENLSNAIMESLSCGLPVVGFDIGGNKDMISHKSNGYLVDGISPTGLKGGITWVIENSDNNLRENARRGVVTKFDSSIIAPKYIELYNNILGAQ